LLYNKNIALALEENAKRRGSHPAIIDGPQVLSYRNLDITVKKISGHIKDQNIEEGNIIGVCLPDTADHLMVLYAIARLGAIILPIDWRWTETERINIATFFKVSLIIGIPEKKTSGFKNLSIDDKWHASVENRTSDTPCATGGTRPVVLSLSSGSTGRPKGPMLTHSQFTARFVMQWVTLGFNQHDRYLSATPIYFGGGRSFTMGCLYSGSTVILFPPPYEPEELVTAATNYQATTLLLVPTLLRRLLKLPKRKRPLLADLNRLLSTGAVLHPDERKAVMQNLNPNFINYYGSTEGGGTSVLLPHHTASTSVGEAIYQTEIEIVDDCDQKLSTNQLGHIRYRSPGVSRNFFNDPEASAACFRKGWFYPGDIGSIDENGFLYLKGRAKDIIIKSGINIYPAEIEQVFLSHPTIDDVVAVPWSNSEYGEDIAVFAVTNKHIEEKELLLYCREKLASYKVPKGVFFIKEIPKTALGKVIKSKLIKKLSKT